MWTNLRNGHMLTLWLNEVLSIWWTASKHIWCWEIPVLLNEPLRLRENLSEYSVCQVILTSQNKWSRRQWHFTNERYLRWFLPQACEPLNYLVRKWNPEIWQSKVRDSTLTRVSKMNESSKPHWIIGVPRMRASIVWPVVMKMMVPLWALLNTWHQWHPWPWRIIARGMRLIKIFQRGSSLTLLFISRTTHHNGQAVTSHIEKQILIESASFKLSMRIKVRSGCQSRWSHLTLH